MIVVDTSLLVEHLRGTVNVATFLEREARRQEVLVPALVEWEFWKGAETGRERSAVAELLGSLTTDPLSASIARIAGDLYQTHRRAGTERPVWDVLIASHALFHDAPLATLDRDYARIEGLDVIDVPLK